MPVKRASTDAPVYQIKVTLKDSKPPIWRRIQVRSDVTLGDLHHVLQAVMGWEDYHLHQFIVGRTYYGQPDLDFEYYEVRDEDDVRLNQVVPGEGLEFTYEYDFGDNWQHRLSVERVLPAEPGAQYPVCVAGKGACPPEDVGGVWGYYGFLEAIRDSEHPEHEETLAWIGGEFDPQAFDLEAVNRELRALRHIYPEGWNPDDWLVPFVEGRNACMHHGHPDPDDHSLCGPALFCCVKSASLYVDLFPESDEAGSEWQLTEAAHIATWMDAGVNVLFFVFCDPARRDGLLAIGLHGQQAREVLLKRIPLEHHVDEAQRLY
jgi:hypothetical protein